MAQPMMCDAEDGSPAVLLVTNLETGDANAWCTVHVPEFIRQMAEATGLLTAEYHRGQADNLADMLKKHPQLAAPKTPGKTRKASAAKDTGPAGESTPAPEPDEDEPLLVQADNGHPVNREDGGPQD